MLMNAAEIIDIDSLIFIEPQFADLPDAEMNNILLSFATDTAKMLIDNHDDLLAVAFFTTEGWVAGSFHLRTPSLELIEHLEETEAEIYQEEREVWEAAVRRYYAERIMDTVSPGMEEMNPDRVPMVTDLIRTYLGDIKGEHILDCCCGSGIGSLVMRESGAIPLAFDNDPELLSHGLKTGRILPEQVIWIDGILLPLYVSRHSTAIGLMLGEINSLNQQIWQTIIHEIIALSDRCLLTVGTKEETEFISESAQAAGKKIRIDENTRDPIYDRWVCFVTGSL